MPKGQLICSLSGKQGRLNLASTFYKAVVQDVSDMLGFLMLHQGVKTYLQLQLQLQAQCQTVVNNSIHLFGVVAAWIQ